MADLKRAVTRRARSRARPSARQHAHSLAFGLGMGLLAVFILIGSVLFNDRIIAPFITPSKSISATPVIIDPNNTAAGPEPKVIIPKINVEIPTVYDVGTIEEEAVQSGLERGVVHYASTPKPGEQGNTVVFGHSSNNILNKGRYKFAFVLLSRLEPGDLFYLQRDGTRYAYRVYDKRVVKPEDVGVLDSIPGKQATATLITCDPPGTTINRLIVIGEQISPNPSGNLASTALPQDHQPAQLAGNAESLWQRLTGWL